MQKETLWSCPQGSVGERDREGCLEKMNSGGKVSRGLVLTPDESLICGSDFIYFLTCLKRSETSDSPVLCKVFE